MAAAVSYATACETKKYLHGYPIFPSSFSVALSLNTKEKRMMGKCRGIPSCSTTVVVVVCLLSRYVYTYVRDKTTQEIAKRTMASIWKWEFM